MSDKSEKARYAWNKGSPLKPAQSPHEVEELLAEASGRTPEPAGMTVRGITVDHVLEPVGRKVAVGGRLMRGWWGRGE